TIPLNDISDFDLVECNDQVRCVDLVLDPTESKALTDIDDDLELPLTERYFLGGLGAFQVRGFKQRSLGPRRAVLNTLPVAGGRLFFASGRLLTGGCPTEDPTCANTNSLNDTDIDDFEDLEFADVIGGNKMFLLNLELQFPISEELGLRGIVFFDMGNAFAENESINPADLRFGVGAGLQWFSPFGPILMQLGFPLDALEDEDGSVFEFSFGGSQF
ncbi:MAG: BamA/TamA family outer membrane protein, partial [Myxococcales bacterium]|nr:BamA/TamA family outer membrane protein [Myxococcales bacterium]